MVNLQMSTKKTQRRGIRFPMFPLGEALKVARTVYEDGGGNLSQETTAESLGHSVKSSTFIGKVSSAKHYGLIISKKKNLEVTSLAKEILRPTSKDESEAGLKKAFFNFEIFKTIYERFKDAYIPKQDILENILIREYGFSDASKEAVYNSFIESGKYSNLILENEKGYFCKEKEEKEDIIIRDLGLKANLIEFFDKIGSLKMIVKLYSYCKEENKDEIISFFRDIILIAIELATELKFLATTMSLKITSDNVGKIPFENIGEYIKYIEDGIKRDLNLE